MSFLPPRFHALPADTKLWALNEAARISLIKNRVEKYAAMGLFRREWVERAVSVKMCKDLFPPKLWQNYLSYLRSAKYRQTKCPLMIIPNEFRAHYLHTIMNKSDLRKILKACIKNE